MARAVEAVGAAVAGGMLVACAIVSPVVDAPPAPFSECETGAFAYHGRTSLAAIGLGDIVGGAEAQRVGEVWVTAGHGNGADWPPPAAGVHWRRSDASSAWSSTTGAGCRRRSTMHGGLPVV